MSVSSAGGRCRAGERRWGAEPRSCHLGLQRAVRVCESTLIFFGSSVENTCCWCLCLFDGVVVGSVGVDSGVGCVAVAVDVDVDVGGGGGGGGVIVVVVGTARAAAGVEVSKMQRRQISTYALRQHRCNGCASRADRDLDQTDHLQLFYRSSTGDSISGFMKCCAESERLKKRTKYTSAVGSAKKDFGQTDDNGKPIVWP